MNPSPEGSEANRRHRHTILLTFAPSLNGGVSSSSGSRLEQLGSSSSTSPKCLVDAKRHSKPRIVSCKAELKAQEVLEALGAAPSPLPE